MELLEGRLDHMKDRLNHRRAQRILTDKILHMEVEHCAMEFCATTIPYLVNKFARQES